VVGSSLSLLLPEHPPPLEYKVVVEWEREWGKKEVTTLLHRFQPCDRDPVGASSKLSRAYDRDLRIIGSQGQLSGEGEEEDERDEGFDRQTVQKKRHLTEQTKRRRNSSSE
jgi:hypothetical protein